MIAIARRPTWIDFCVGSTTTSKVSTFPGLHAGEGAKSGFKIGYHDLAVRLQLTEQLLR